MIRNTHLTWEGTSVRTHRAPLETWRQHTQLLEIWLENLKAQNTKFYGQFLSFSTLLNDLRDQKNKCMHGSATQTKGHSPEFRLKKLNWRWVPYRVTCNCVRRYKKHYMLTNMDQPPAEQIFCDENKEAPMDERLDKNWTRLQLWWQAKYMALSGIETWTSS